MMWRRIAGVMLALPLAMGICQVFAQTNQDQGNKGQQQQRHDRPQLFANKLGLNEQQKEQIRKICNEFDEKVGRVDHQIWSLVHQEKDAIFNILTDEQKAKVPTVLKEEMEKEMNKIAGTLGVNDAEKLRLKQICEKYESKFYDLAKQQGDDAAKKMHELRHEAFSAISQELTEEQKVKLPGIIREEMHRWHDPSARAAHLRTLGDKLNLNEDQRKQIQQVLTGFAPKLEQPKNELRQLLQQEQTALENVLNEQQRTKLREMMQNTGGGK